VTLTVAVTGATGIFGRALCARLEHDPAVERVLGLARRPFDPAEHGFDKMEFRPADVLDRVALDAAFAGADVVCHLAFTVLDRGMDADQVERINVDGSRNVFAAAAGAGARRIVYASSVAAYGAHADNPVPITEDQPTRGNAGFYYAEHKAAVEALLDDFEVGNPGVEVTRLRPCVTVGPNSVDLFRGPLPVPIVGVLLSPLLPFPLPDPGVAPFQLVHEDDVAEAFALAITAPRTHGTFNVAGGGTITLGELASTLGAIRVPVPGGIMRRAVDAAHRLRVAPTTGDWLDMLRHPVIVDTARLRVQLGWVPRFDTRTALQDMVDCYRQASPLPG
jgi:UDP-glucose 4-epimerase